MLPGSAQEAISNTLTLYKYDDAVRWELPGSGSPRADCGQDLYLGHPDGNKTHWVKHKKSCHRRDCPVCYQDWIVRASMAALDRLTSWHNAHDGKLISHYTISPPQDIQVTTRTQYRDLKKQLYKVMKKSGIRGGVLVFHQRGMRYSDPETYLDKHEDHMGIHFHVLGDGWTRPESYEPGWVVKNLKIRKSAGGIVGTMKYILDHCAVGYPANSQSTELPDWELKTITWFGNMSYNKLHVPHFTGPETIYCPICKEEISKDSWYVLSWIGTKDPPNSDFGESEQGQNGFYLGRPVTGWSGFY